MRKYNEVFTLKYPWTECTEEEFCHTEYCYDAQVINKIPVKKFRNGELYVEVDTKADTENVLIIAHITNNINEEIFGLLLAIDALKRQGHGVGVMIPCMPYARQDRTNGRMSCISSAVLVKMLESAGMDEFFTYDMHAEQLEALFTVPMHNLKTDEFFCEKIGKIYSDYMDKLCIVSPDAGGVKRAKKYADHLQVPLALIHKQRDPVSGAVTSHNIIGDVEDKVCIIVDDMIDSGSTIVNAAFMLKQHGADHCSVVATHGYFSDQKIAAQIITNQTGVDKFYITNSVNNYSTKEDSPHIKTYAIDEHFLRWIIIDGRIENRN